MATGKLSMLAHEATAAAVVSFSHDKRHLRGKVQSQELFQYSITYVERFHPWSVTPKNKTLPYKITRKLED